MLVQRARGTGLAIAIASNTNDRTQSIGCVVGGSGWPALQSIVLMRFSASFLSQVAEGLFVSLPSCLRCQDPASCAAPCTRRPMLQGERTPPELDYTNDVPRLPTKREMVQDGRGLCSTLEFSSQRISSTSSRKKGIAAAEQCEATQPAQIHRMICTCFVLLR